MFNTSAAFFLLNFTSFKTFMIVSYSALLAAPFNPISFLKL